MSIQYIKRLQMMYDCSRRALVSATLPPDFVWVPWTPELIDVHARVKYLSFRDDLDAKIFPSFSSQENCRKLMDAITSRQGFIPETTWLIAYVQGTAAAPKYCATIQGIRHSFDSGGIQNVAVLPEFRRRGLGKALLLQALAGFEHVGVRKIALEVTAENTTAVRLYQQVGFQILQTVYKEMKTEGWFNRLKNREYVVR